MKLFVQLALVAVIAAPVAAFAEGNMDSSAPADAAASTTPEHTTVDKTKHTMKNGKHMTKKTHVEKTKDSDAAAPAADDSKM